MGQPSNQFRKPGQKRGPGRPGVIDVVRLLGTGATGSILLAMGGGPLRTGEVTDQLSFVPRTAYRYLDALVALGALSRHEEPVVPSKVVYSLTDPVGTELCELAKAYSKALLELLPNGHVIPQSWGMLIHLADLWESGMLARLELGPSTAMELTRLGHGYSSHQVSRRIPLFITAGLIQETPERLWRRRYELTGQARRAVGLIAAIDRWRERSFPQPGEAAMTGSEAALLLRVTLPLVTLRKHAGKVLRLTVSADGGGADREVIWAEVQRGKAVLRREGYEAQADAWATGHAAKWNAVLAEGPGRMRIGGDRGLIETCLRRMHASLWKGQRGRS